ncbi:MAG: RAP domain-containing protein [Actinomycetota bacterium]
MKNTIYREEFSAAGISSNTIKSALDCCLIRLCRGMYSVIRECRVKDHSRIAAFIGDVDWISFHVDKSPSDLKQDFRYQTQLRALRIRKYRWYRPEDVIVGKSAAVLHGIPLYKDESKAITVRHPRSNSHTKEIIRVRGEVPAEDQVGFGHLTATSAVRTALDLIRISGQREAFAAMEWVLRQTTAAQFPGFNPRFGYTEKFQAEARRIVATAFYPAVARMRSGQVTAQRMVEAIDPFSESPAESNCRFNLIALNLTGFEQQIEVRDDKGFIARVDFLNEQARTILAVDGSEKYALVGPSLIRREGEQHNRLLSMGYKVIHLSFDDVLRLNDFRDKIFTQVPELKQLVGRPDE